MSDPYEFDYGFLEMEAWSPLEFAHLAAGVEIEWDWSEGQGELFRRLPGCWSDSKNRTAVNIRQRIDNLHERAQEATACRHIKTRRPRDWLELAREWGIKPGWLDHAYRDVGMHVFLPPPEAKPAMQKRFNPANTPREERNHAWYVGWVKDQIYASVDRDDKNTWTDDTKSLAVQALLLKTFPELNDGRAQSIDKEARPVYMKKGGRPRDKAGKGV